MFVLRRRFLALTLIATFFVSLSGGAQTTPAPTQTIAQKIAASKDLLDINKAHYRRPALHREEPVGDAGDHSTGSV
jgi:hypothetical protein